MRTLWPCTKKKSKIVKGQAYLAANEVELLATVLEQALHGSRVLLGCMQLEALTDATLGVLPADAAPALCG